MADLTLIDACFMWCIHKRIKPMDWGNEVDKAMLQQAVLEYKGTFAQLNRRQRQRIAGLHAE